MQHSNKSLSSPMLLRSYHLFSVYHHTLIELKWNKHHTDPAGTHLSSISGGENPQCPSTLLHIPEKPESRHLVGLRGDVHVDKQGGELADGPSEEREKESGLNIK